MESDGKVRKVGKRWEFVTVGIPRGNPATFDFVTFSQHNFHHSYLRENIRCDGGGENSCGSASDPQGTRVMTFIAHHSHANYPRPCSRTIPALGIVAQCQQDSPDYRPENGGFDGERRWGNNLVSPDVSLRLFPSLGSGTWLDWPGRWGTHTTPTDAPHGPAQQSHFGTPWTATCGRDNPDCPIYEERTASSAARSTSSAETDPVECDDWFGGLVTVLTCDRTRLAGALDAGTLSATPSVTTSVNDKTIPGAPGISQGVLPLLRLGDRIDVRANVDADLEIVVRVRVGETSAKTLRRSLTLDEAEHAELIVRSTLAGPILERVA